jgi:hypothetical protein
VFILLIALSVYMSANPLGTMSFFGGGDLFANAAWQRNAHLMLLVAAIAFLTPGITLRIMNVVAIKKTLGTRVTWTGSSVSAITAMVTMMLVVFLLGQVAAA